MSKVLVVYFSQTGNTEAMAKAVAEGVEAAGKEAQLVEAENASAADLEAARVFALGSPATGTEEIDDSYMAPLMDEIEGSLSGKKVLLFGSYDWGDGEFMRSWEEKVTSAGAELVTGAGITANLSPDDAAVEALKKAGEELAALI